jgi:hypothetical protein
MVGPAVDEVPPGAHNSKDKLLAAVAIAARKTETPAKSCQEMKGATLCPVETETAPTDPPRRSHASLETLLQVRPRQPYRRTNRRAVPPARPHRRSADWP